MKKKHCMSLRYTHLAHAISLATVMASPGVFAQDSTSSAVATTPHWYIGLSGGRTEESIHDDTIANSLIGGGLTSLSDDASDKGYKLFLGYQFNEYVALEGGYFDLGDDFGFTAQKSPLAGSLVAETGYKGFNFDVVGTTPITQRLSAFARLGLIRYETEDSFVGSGALALNEERSQKDTGYKFGAGLQYAFTERFNVRLEAERYRIEDNLGDHGSVNLYSLGLLYRFGGTSAAPKQEELPPPPAPAEQEYCAKLDIQFEINRADIQREESERLAAAGSFLKKFPHTKAVIEGHTDDVGTDQANLGLSQKRAENVLQYLVSNQNIDSSRLSAVSRGEANPIAENTSEAGKRQNRRINTTIECAKGAPGETLPEARITLAALVEFDKNSTTVKEQYHQDLEKAASYLRDHPEVTAVVEGHAADLQHSAKNAQKISEQRANNVKAYLIEKFGIEPNRLKAEGFGQTRRVAYNTSEEGRQQNRRVNIVLTYPK